MRAALFAVIATFVLGLAPLTAGLPPPPPPGSVGPILVITSPGDPVVSALAAAGYSACAPVLPAGDCFDAVDASLFGTANIADRRVLFVGTHDNSSAIHLALLGRDAEIEAWTAAGGSLLSLTQHQVLAPGNDYAAGGYEYIPSNVAWPFYTVPAPGDPVIVTTYGSTHPAIPTSTDASLSGWSPSFEWGIGERPSYLFPIITGKGTGTYTNPDGTTTAYPLNATIAIAGNFGHGCVLLSTLRADLVAGDPGHPRAGDAAAFLHDIVEWGLHCAPVPPFPVPYGGAIAIGRVNGGSVTATTSPALSCSPLTLTSAGYEVSCVPAVPPQAGTFWTCFGQTVTASYVGLFSLTGTSMCNNSVAATCTASSASAPCAATSGLVQAPLPIRCVAKPSSGTTIAQVNWNVMCGSLDP